MRRCRSCAGRSRAAPAPPDHRTPPRVMDSIARRTTWLAGDPEQLPFRCASPMGRSRDRPSFLDSRYRPFSGKNGTVADFSSAPRKPRCKETVSIIASPPDAPRKKNARKFHPTLRDGHRRPSRLLVAREHAEAKLGAIDSSAYHLASVRIGLAVG